MGAKSAPDGAAVSGESVPLVVEDEGPVVRLRLNRPETHNVLDEELLEAVITALRRIRDQSESKVIVLSGSGADFCVGGDVAELAGAASDDDHELGKLLRLGREVCRELAAAEAVTIARLHGRVIGAGLAVALHCDLRVGAEDTAFRLPELGLGVPPMWGGAIGRFRDEIGAARLRELILLGEPVDAATAVAYGIVHRALPEGEVDALIDRWCRRFARRDPAATRIAKNALEAGAVAARLGDVSVVEDDLFRAGAGRLRR